MEYEEFIKTKKNQVLPTGFDPIKINPMAKPYQAFCIENALKTGRYALFLDTGLGKTICQLDWAQNVVKHTNKPVLIVAPLSIVSQTRDEESVKFGYRVFDAGTSNEPAIEITNYENLENIDLSIYVGVVLDESGILKNFLGKTRNTLIESFKNTPYRLACSATPSPNDHTELGNHSEFLGYMTYTEMLAMYFVHDGGETSKWRLRKHAEDDFWNYILSFSIAMDHPSTFGFDEPDLILPKIEYIEHKVNANSGNEDLFGDAIVSATTLHRELAKITPQRLKKVKEVFETASNDQWVFWALNNEFSKELQNIIPDSVDINGSQSKEFKREKLKGFKYGNPKNIITKAKLAGFGLNWQHCNHICFTEYDFSFEKFYQAVRRVLRFYNQHEKIYCHIITPSNQANVKRKIKESEIKHKERIKNLAKRSSNFENEIKDDKKMKDLITDDYKCLIGDCVQRAKDIKDNELDHVIFSPPFSELYVYSDKIEDMGNSKDYKQFEQHFKYLIPEISRTLKDGRICAVHCMDLPIQKGKEGFIGLRDFSGMLIDWFTECGFIYHSRVTIWKNPVTEMQRTKAVGLLHKTIRKDSSMSRVGIPDYVLFFRNKGENKTPIMHFRDHQEAFDFCAKNPRMDMDRAKRMIFPVDLWQKYASPVWYDVDYSRTLQYTTARDANDEKHICPLQLDTIERSIRLYTNEGEVVGSFFGGIGSEGYKALKMGRKSVSIELKESYFKVNTENHKNAMLENSELTLF